MKCGVKLVVGLCFLCATASAKGTKAKLADLAAKDQAQEQQINLLMEQVSDLTSEVLSLKSGEPKAITTTATLGGGNVYAPTPSSVPIIIIRTGDLSAAKTVRYRTVPITATPHTDYEVVDAETTIPANTTFHVADSVLVHVSANGIGTQFMLQIYDPSDGLGLDDLAFKIVNIVEYNGN